MKRFVLAALVAALSFAVPALSAPAAAADSQAEREQLAQEMYGVLKLDRTLTQVFDLMEQQVVDMLRQENQEVDPQVAKDLAAIIKEEAKPLLPQIRANSISILVRHFSLEDLKNMLAFYQTETGRRAIDRMPLVLQDSNAATMKLIPAFQARLEKRFEAYAKEKGL